jgi:hypothetical protein
MQMVIPNNQLGDDQSRQEGDSKRKHGVII